nr:hypothetical protein [Tanacetum cinerariifolium]
GMFAKTSISRGAHGLKTGPGRPKPNRTGLKPTSAKTPDRNVPPFSWFEKQRHSFTDLLLVLTPSIVGTAPIKWKTRLWGAVLSPIILEHRPLSFVANEPLEIKLGTVTFEDEAAFKCSSIVEDVKVPDSYNLLLLLKKLIDRGKVSLKDVASEINVSANLLASNFTDDCFCFPLDLHEKIAKWLQNHAHVDGLQKTLKLESFGDDRVVVDEDKNGCIIREDQNLRSEESSPDSREKVDA